MKEICRDNRLPVLIPARNEALWLPKILSALPNALVLPVVVVNDSTDETKHIAEGCGVPTLESAPGKMRAIKAGLTQLGKKSLEPLVILDADAVPLFPRHWAQTYLRQLSAPNSGVSHLGLCFGSNLRETMGRVAQAAVSANRIHCGRGNQGGPNMAVHLNEASLELIQAMPNYWP